MKTFYKNRLPHLAPIGATFFVTFRLADSLPTNIIQKLSTEFEQKCQALKAQNIPNLPDRIREERKRYFGKFEHQLDTKIYGSCYLAHPEIATIVADRMQQYNGQLYQLHAYCIMPNHVHLLMDTMEQLKVSEDVYLEDAPLNYVQLNEIMRLIKGGSARLANQALGREGAFWMKDSYDHYVRNEREWGNIIRYILNNPVNAGLVNDWQAWPFSYCNPAL
ncbi:MAG TPA: hypothetical protein PKC76_02405 [Saprospiraceae bacterium]|nr:hypothetical protein [Saprospiraceae bacterium]HMP22951.1 hypothetical protein [Saprospiraceae bacterium]